MALKIPSFDVGTIREARRFRVEAQSMARLEHRNIVRVLDVTDYQGRPVLSMELVSGGSLDQHLERFRNNQRSLATLMVDIARGVHHAHQRGILHRDLKPSNILLDTDEHGPDHPHVSDFGLAKPMDVSEPRTGTTAHLGPGTTEYGKIVGTASYMSPEQASGRDATTLSDVYGLGGILYALLTGRPPFREESAEDTLAHVREPTRRPRLPRDINADSDRTLEAICLKCLEKDPTHRYRSAEGLAKDLDRWLASRPTEARRRNALGRTVLWCRRSPLGAGLVVALIAVMSLTGAQIADRLQEPRRNRLIAAQQTAELLENRLEDMKEAVEATAGHPQLADLLAQGNLPALQTLVEGEGSSHDDLDGSSPFESLFLIDSRNGEIVARWPSMDPETEGVDFRARNYYQGLLSSSTFPEAYVSRVYKALPAP